MKNYTIKTKRLGLRNWIDEDIEPFAKICADKRVMEFFPSMWTLKQTTDFIKRMKVHYKEYGFCYFAVDRLDTNEFIGFIGLMHQNYETSFAPFVDIGWRLSPQEGATACLNFAFAELNLIQVYAIAPNLNKKSQRVMEKLGMQFHSTFMHPKIDKNDPLQECVAYKIDTNNTKLLSTSHK